MFYIITVIAGLVIGLICFPFLVSMLKKAKTLPRLDDDIPSVARIIVPPTRVKLFAVSLSLVGLFFISVSQLSDDYTVRQWSFWIFTLLPLILGTVAILKAVHLLFRSNNLIQLELDKTEMRSRPIKWYSRGRFRNQINALSVYFSNEWIETPYHDISTIELRSNGYTGNQLFLTLRDGETWQLVMIANNKTQIQEVKEAVEKRIY